MSSIGLRHAACIFYQAKDEQKSGSSGHANAPEHSAHFEDFLVFDPRPLEELRDAGGDELIVELIDLFLQDSPPRARSVLNAIAALDCKSLEEAAHALKSSSAAMGALRLAQLCQHLEDLGEGGKTTTVLALAPEFEAAFSDVMTVFMNKKGAPKA